MNKKLHINVAQEIARRAATLTPAQRKVVEDAKDANKIDPEITRQAIERLGPILSASTNLDEVRVAVSVSIDAALAVLAFCQDEKEIAYVHQRAQQGAGPLRRERVKFDFQGLRSSLKAVFFEIADRYELHKRGVNDRALVRRKINVALEIIILALNDKETKTKPE